MEDILYFLIILFLLGLAAAAFVRYRAQLTKWVKDPKYGSTWYPSRETNLKRDIEDAEAELKELSETESEE